MKKYIDTDQICAEIKQLKEKYPSWQLKLAMDDLYNFIDSLQQEQPEVDLKKDVEFECIGKKVKMTVQELINYYIDKECCEVADECGF